MPLPPGFKVVKGTYQIDATKEVIVATCNCGGVPERKRLRTIETNPDKYSVWPPKATATPPETSNAG